MDQKADRVVIIGGGFGGLAAARELCGAAVTITLVDRSNHHLFQPLSPTRSAPCSATKRTPACSWPR